MFTLNDASNFNCVKLCKYFIVNLDNLDDVVLDDIYQYHLPPRRRVPPLLWARIRSPASNIVLAPTGAQEVDMSVVNVSVLDVTPPFLLSFLTKCLMINPSCSHSGLTSLATWRTLRLTG